MHEITQETLREIARRLPPTLRNRYFEERKLIRERLAQERWRAAREPVPHGRPRSVHGLVPWDDPEYIARCLFYLNDLNQQVQNAVNRLAGS